MKKKLFYIFFTLTIFLMSSLLFSKDKVKFKCSKFGDIDFSKYKKFLKSGIKILDFMPGGKIKIGLVYPGSVKIVGWNKSKFKVKYLITSYGSSEKIAEENIDKIYPRIAANDFSGLIETEISRKDVLGRIDYVIYLPKYRTDLKIDIADGFVDITDMNGWIEITDCKGYLKFKNMRGYVSAVTKKGDILSILNGNRWEGLTFSARTYDGDAVIFMPVKYDVDLTLITLNGKIDVDYPPMVVDGEEYKLIPTKKKKGEGLTQTLGEGGPPVMIQCDKGNISLKQYDPKLEYVEDK